MSKFTQQTLKQKILDVKNALTLLKQENFPQQLSEYGYNQETIAIGQRLYEEASALIAEKNAADLNMKRALQKIDKAIEIAKTFYNEQVAIARVAFTKDPMCSKILNINGRRKKTFNGWVKQAETFYFYAQNPEILVHLQRFGTTLAKLHHGQQLITKLSDLYSKKIDTKGLAQVATESRNKKCAELFAWYWDFKRIAQIALGKNSQQLERFGITVYSSGNKPKKNAE